MPDSFDYTTGTNSENVRLLQALIDDAPEYTEETNSRNANILKSIINNTEYTDAPQSEIEELLLRLKAKIGGEIEVDELTVTENGTYDAGVNKAYNPVKVELPLSSKTITENGTYTASDDNLAGYDEVTVAVEGYAKKSIPNTPTDIATFNASALPMPSLTVGIEAVQAGNGDPSPTNVRPISGWSAVNVYDGPTTDPQDATVYTIDLDGTRYGGTLDVVSGTLVVDRVAKVFDGSEDWSPNGNKGVFIRTSNIPNIETSKTFITDVYKTVPNGEAPPDGCINYNSARNAIQIHDERAMTSEAYKTLLQTNPVQLVYELATPQTIQLTPTAVKSLLGTNNLWADSGKVISGEYMEEL